MSAPPERRLPVDDDDILGCDPVQTRRARPFRPWQDIAADKKAEQLARIPREWLVPPALLPDATATATDDLRPLAAASGVLTDRELDITGGPDATALLAEVAAGRLTAVEVVTAFCKRAAVAQQACNCLTEIMFADALADAARLDEAFRATGRTVGPLHGLPMTFKECFHVKGYDASDGYVSRAFDPSTTDSHLVTVVRAAGAVVIAKTNTPQTMLVAETHNNLFGRTRNPVVPHLTPGGSSGGEASLLAFGGSALGVGTDVGGSIRIPSAACGVYGLKPSSGVLPMLGYAASGWTGAHTGVPAVCGPMGRSLRDLRLLAAVVRASRPWLADPAVVPFVFASDGASTSTSTSSTSTSTSSTSTSTSSTSTSSDGERRPVVGLVERAGLTPHPPVLRALRRAAGRLRAAGLEVRPFAPADLAEVRRVARQLFTVDGLSYQRRELARAGEPPVPSVRRIGFVDLPAKTHEEMWSWSTRRLALQKDMLDRWAAAGVDVVLCPAGPHTAVRPDGWCYDTYTVCWNVVDYPAVVIPFTHVDSAVDRPDENFQPLSEEDETVQSWYDPDLMHGAPVCLQIVARRLCDDQLLADAAVIDRILNGP